MPTRMSLSNSERVALTNVSAALQGQSGLESETGLDPVAARNILISGELLMMAMQEVGADQCQLSLGADLPGGA